MSQQVSYRSFINQIFARILEAYGRFVGAGLKITTLRDLSEAPGQGVIFALEILPVHLGLQLDCDLSMGSGEWEGSVGEGSWGEWCAVSSNLGTMETDQDISEEIGTSIFIESKLGKDN